MINEYKEVKLKEGNIVIIEPEYIYYLSKGTAQLWELHSDGVEILINLLKPDDAIKLPIMSFSSIYELRTAKEKALFSLYKWDPFHRIEEKYFLLNKVTSTLMRTESFNLIKRQKFVRKRLILLLQYLVKEHGESFNENYSIINILLTHEQLSSLILSTRTTVTRLLSEFKRDNIIRYIHGYICLNNSLSTSIDDYTHALQYG